MAVHGKNTTVFWNEWNMTGYLDNADFSLDAETGESTTFGKGWKEFIAGLNTATLGFTGKYEANAGTAIESKLAVDSGVLTYSPGGGAAIGDRARLAPVTATSYVETSPVGDVVTFGWDTLAEGAVGLGWMLHPLGEDTNTTTGSSRDDGAATSTGWQAHLHVTVVDAGSWVVKLQDSANNSDWSDVSGGAFTAATGATSQRLTSAAGATLRRYVRYVATRTGGTSGDGITFALAYARNV